MIGLTSPYDLGWLGISAPSVVEHHDSQRPERVKLLWWIQMTCHQMTTRRLDLFEIFWIRPFKPVSVVSSAVDCFLLLFTCVYIHIYIYINTIMTISWRMFMYAYAYTMWIFTYCWVVLFLRVRNGGNGGTRREIQHGRESQAQQTSWLLLLCL